MDAFLAIIKEIQRCMSNLTKVFYFKGDKINELYKL